MWRSTARLVITMRSAIAALLQPSATRARISCSRGVSVSKRRVLAPSLRRQQQLDDPRVDDRAPRGHLPQRTGQVAPVLDAILEQVGAAIGAVLQELRRIQRLGVLAEDHDADVRLRPPELGGEPDALVGVRRRHADVRQHDVGTTSPTVVRSESIVAARRDDLDVLLVLEHAQDRLASQVAVLAEDDRIVIACFPGSSWGGSRGTVRGHALPRRDDLGVAADGGNAVAHAGQPVPSLRACWSIPVA